MEKCSRRRSDRGSDHDSPGAVLDHGPPTGTETVAEKLPEPAAAPPASIVTLSGASGPNTVTGGVDELDIVLSESSTMWRRATHQDDASLRQRITT